jgi:hypothetical protein
MPTTSNDKRSAGSEVINQSRGVPPMRIAPTPRFGTVFLTKPPVNKPVSFEVDGKTYWVTNGKYDTDREDLLDAQAAYNLAAVTLQGLKKSLSAKAN